MVFISIFFSFSSSNIGRFEFCSCEWKLANSKSTNHAQHGYLNSYNSHLHPRAHIKYVHRNACVAGVDISWDVRAVFVSIFIFGDTRVYNTIIPAFIKVASISIKHFTFPD